jgi:hypothetical protein
MAMMEKIERIKQHATVEELQAMLLQTEKSSESRSSSPPKHRDAAGSDVKTQALDVAPQAKKSKGKSSSSSSKARPLPGRSASVPLEAAGASAADGRADSASAVSFAAAAAGGGGGNGHQGEDGGNKDHDDIAFIVDGRFDQRPSTSASKSR